MIFSRFSGTVLDILLDNNGAIIKDLLPDLDQGTDDLFYRLTSHQVVLNGLNHKASKRKSFV